MEPWTFERLTTLIDSGVEESLTLDYKAAGALQKDDRKRAEITKDVSAMANSAGGTIIYGVKEYSDPSKSHLPESIDAIARRAFPKEWLEHVIQNIRPRIEGIVITPLSLPSDPEGVIYVVEIPQSSTAHQAADHRYYRRYNFESVSMHDHEIRDVMARRQHPLLDLSFHLLYKTHYIVSGGGFTSSREKRRPFTVIFLCATAQNNGRRVANYVNASIYIPPGVVNTSRSEKGDLTSMEGVEYHKYQQKNLVRDVVGRTANLGFSTPQYGENRYEPILPELSLEIGRWEVDVTQLKSHMQKGSKITWECFADESPKRVGEYLLLELPVVDKRDANAEE
jgi:hypothetical protein